jgi:hypothetical protein
LATPAERAGFLASACGDDQQLRQYIKTLLRISPMGTTLFPQLRAKVSFSEF